MTTLCPVCGNELEFAPWRGENPSDEICPCCGIQFGYDDFSTVVTERERYYDEWRIHWIGSGMRWVSQSQQPAEGWDPRCQLRRIGHYRD